MLKEKNDTIRFFKEMEANILREWKLRGRSDSPEETSNTSSAEQINYVDDKENQFVSDVDRRTRFGSFCGSVQGVPALPARIRTISTMDDDILMSMKIDNFSDSQPKQATDRPRSLEKGGHCKDMDRDPYPEGVSLTSSHKAQCKTTPQKRNRCASNTQSRLGSTKHSSQADLLKGCNHIEQPLLKRRNSTGTIYIATTMSKQDTHTVAAQVDCVCVVIRAHMLSAAKEGITPLPVFDLFKDSQFKDRSPSSSIPSFDRGLGVAGFGSSHDSSDSGSSGSSSGSAKEREQKVPSLETVKEFFMTIFMKSQLENDCIIMALIYCERLVKETKGRFCIRFDNWRSILFACLVMSSKVWDDLSMWNADFSQVCPSFNLERVNELELGLLEALKYCIRVTASEYAKYYFHLREMIARLGLNKHEQPTHLNVPLSMEGARKLQITTENKRQHLTRASVIFCGGKQVVSSGRGRPRCSSMAGPPYSQALSHSQAPTSKAGAKETEPRKGEEGNWMKQSDHARQLSGRLKLGLSLEEIVHPDHVDADGSVHKIRVKRSEASENRKTPTVTTKC